MSTFCVVSGTLHAVLLSLVWTSMKRATTHLPVELWAGGSHVIGGHQPSQRHDVQPSKLVSWSGHVFLFVNTVRPSHLAVQRSTLAYMMEQSPAELRSLDVYGRSTSEH